MSRPSRRKDAPGHRESVEGAVDHYIPKRRIPVTLWSTDLHGVRGQMFLDLDAAQQRHQTILEKLNETTPFVPVGIGDEGRIHLYNKQRLARLTVGRQVGTGDIYHRGFEPWREEAAEVMMADGTMLAGKVWMPLRRATQRLSDYFNQLGSSFFVLHSPTGTHLINAAAVVEVKLDESAGAPIGSGEEEAAA